MKYPERLAGHCEIRQPPTFKPMKLIRLLLFLTSATISISTIYYIIA